MAFSSKFQKGWLKENNGDDSVSSIFRKVGREYIKFKITDNIANRCYVLEQKYWKEDYFMPILKKKFGSKFEKYLKQLNLFDNKKSTNITFNDFKKSFIQILFARYYKSIVRLDDYKGNYKVPEFWIGKDLNVNKSEFGKVSFMELEEKTGVTKKDIVERKLSGADYSEKKKKSSNSSIVSKV